MSQPPDDTLLVLDWPALREALSEHARTSAGRRAARDLAALPDVDAVRRAHDEVDEVLALERDGGWVPVGAVGDVAGHVDRAAKGAVLDKAELREASLAFVGLDDLGSYLVDADAPHLGRHAEVLAVDTGVLDTLRYAFDPTGELNEHQWPELGVLRRRIADLHQAIRRTLEELVKGDDLAEALQDRFVTQRGDRYVLPIKVSHKRRDMGIVHGLSGSGQTAFVEPTQVIHLNNELRLAEGELEATERRILQQLSGIIARAAPGLLAALDAALEIDLACARAGLARALDAVRPVVHDAATVVLRGARHPLLALRRVPVVPNDLQLDARTPAMVISGPNTGGKTVALKTLGLCTLLVRVGCFIPASPGSRVDLFPVVTALIGDHQTVQGDHSSFSSHVAALRAMIDVAGPGALFLIDEIASGTDPQQGAALAHAVLEALVDRGARAVITTHFHRLKTLGAVDPRFAMAGMQFADGRPTFRLISGASGESHALSVAARMGIPAPVLERARNVMGEDERGLADVLAALERARSDADDARRQAARLADELRADRGRLAEREAELTRRARDLEQREAAAFLDRLAGAEKAIAAVVADLQRAPSHKKVDAAKATLDALRALAPSAPEPAPAPAATVAAGDRVRVRKLGQIGDVREVDGDVLTVVVGAMTLRLAPTEVEPVSGRKARAAAPTRAKPPPVKRADLADAVRLPGNTVDLRGLRVEEGLDEVERFLADAARRGFDAVFVLHGHGTGAMKDAVRRWLPSCAAASGWLPADASQGGDAYTIVGVR